MPELLSDTKLYCSKNDGPARKLIGIEVLERGIPRPHYPIYADGVQIGEVTTGTQSPTLKRNLGLALIDSKYTAIGTPLEIEIRGKTESRGR